MDWVWVQELLVWVQASVDGACQAASLVLVLVLVAVLVLVVLGLPWRP